MRKDHEWQQCKWNRRRILKKYIFYLFQTPLTMTCQAGSVECVNTLINHGADMAAKDVRSERVCESTSLRRRDVWEFLWFTVVSLFGCFQKVYSFTETSQRVKREKGEEEKGLFAWIDWSLTFSHTHTHTHAHIHFLPEASWVCVLCVLLDSISWHILNFSSQNLDNCHVFSMISL